ncbi:MAG: hypothetical protein HY554_00210 [Elusimicrobia bacterium]|nr:hypothetical protein [Elusimicrobiota bacterium]
MVALVAALLPLGSGASFTNALRVAGPAAPAAAVYASAPALAAEGTLGGLALPAAFEPAGRPGTAVAPDFSPAGFALPEGFDRPGWALADALGRDPALAGDAAGLFDGLAPRERDEALERLESLVKARPKDAGLRRAFQDLVVRDELERVEPLLRGRPLTPERRDAVLSATRFVDIRWWHRFGGRWTAGADGEAWRDLSLALYVRRGWRSIPSLVTFYRALFSHEYAHRLQFEGESTTQYGLEVPPVGAELLRAIELAGLSGVRSGALRTIGAGLLDEFERGRAWGRGAPTPGRPGASGFYWKGYLAGAAYELAQATGRWADAWSFHREVSSGGDPGEARRRLLLRATASLVK